MPRCNVHGTVTFIHRYIDTCPAFVIYSWIFTPPCSWFVLLWWHSGFGFVTFSSVDDSKKCVADQPHQLDGRTVEAKPAVPKGQNVSLLLWIHTVTYNCTAVQFVHLSSRMTNVFIAGAIAAWRRKNPCQQNLSGRTVAKYHRGQTQRILR